MPNMQDEIRKEGLEDLAKYAKVWVEKYARSRKNLNFKEIPQKARELNDKQKNI